MSADQRDTLLLRERIMGLLSNEEVARVSSAESSARPPDGDEYLDLEHLERGVRNTVDSTVAVGTLLPRKTVRDATWTSILAELPAHDRAVPPPAGPVPR